MAELSVIVVKCHVHLLLTFTNDSVCHWDVIRNQLGCCCDRVI